MQDRDRRSADRRRTNIAIASIAPLFEVMVWEPVIRPAARVAIWLVRCVWITARPSLFRALWVNRRIPKIPEHIAEREEADWRRRLRASTREDQELAVNILLTGHESDQNRIRGIESKALGVLQSAGIVFAGDVAALTLATRENASHAQLAIWLVVASWAYLVAALGASLFVAKPGQRFVFSNADLLPPDLAGARLAIASRLNQAASIARSNLTESAIFDAARAFATAAVALVLAIPTS